MSVGLADEDERTQQKTTRLTPRSLKYAQFEVEIAADGFPFELGAGAMAVTYRARDTILNSRVALKVIDRSVAKNPGVQSRFLREARAAAQIHHPNVARVSQYGEQDGECFYAMELVEGETLESRVRRDGPLPLDLALEIMEQAARALVAAEACGVVHRDIKPSNIMLESDPSGAPIAKVIDYGIAKVLQPDAQPGAEQTQAGFIGTPAFASPEQFAEGGQARIDTRSDIYSLGLTFWYLLTGQAPFPARSIEEIRGRETEQLPLVQLKCAHAPALVVTLLKSMLAIDPGKRPQTALALLTAVHHCYLRFEPAARRRRKHLVLAVSGLALMLALIILSTFLYQRARSSSELDRSIAVLPFENLTPDSKDQFLSAGIQDEILTRLASLADLKVISRTSTEKYNSKPVALKTVGQQLGVGRVLEGTVQIAANKVRVNVQLLDARTDTHLWAKTYDRKFYDAFAVETEVANAVAQQLDSKLVERITSDRPTANTAAYNAYLRGVGIEHGQANSGFQSAAAAYTEAVLLDPNFALAWARLSLVRSFFYINGIDRNANSPTTVKEAADRAVELRPDLGEAWLAQGQYRSAVLRDREGALQAYQKAQKYLPNSSLVNEYMCLAEVRLGRWREAESHLLKATELDPRNVRLWAKTAQQVFSALRRWADAQAAIDRALEISPNDEEAITRNADNFQGEGRLDEAAKLLARLPKDSTEPYLLNLRAYQAMFERKFDNAIFWTQQLMKESKPGQPLSYLSILALVRQGYFQEWAGRPDEARATFERVIHEIAPTPGSVIPSGRETRSMLALAYAGLGDKQNALEQAHQGVADFANDVYVKPRAETFLAQVQSQCGDVDAAIAGVSHLLEVPNGMDPSDLRYSPFWDPLRKDPRFKELLKHPPPVRY